MITKEDIEAVRARVDERTEKFREMLRVNPNRSPDEALAALVSTPGWDILKYALDQYVLTLLEPETFETTSEAYAISGQARYLSINEIRSILEAVETAAEARRSSVAPDQASEGVSE